MCVIYDIKLNASIEKVFIPHHVCVVVCASAPICGVFVVCAQRMGKKAQKSRCTSSTYRIKCDTLHHAPKNVTQSNRTACGIFAVKKFSSQWSCSRYSFLCRTKIHLHCHLKEKLLRSCGSSQRENVRLDFSLKPTSSIDFVMEKSDSIDRSRPS